MPERSNEERGVTTVTAPVRRVTVMEDRAQVERSAEVELAAGRQLLRVTRVTPLVVDRTLRGRLEGPDGKLVDLRIERESTVDATRPALEGELKAQLEEARRSAGAARGELAVAQSTSEDLLLHRQQLLDGICHEAGRGESRLGYWRDALARVERQLEQGRDEATRLTREVEDAEERCDRIEQRRHAALQPTSDYWADLTAAVEIAQPGRYTIAWVYLVPCAIWRPTHQATLAGDEPQRLRWTGFGTVWQRTGEPWDEIELAFSTERPALGAELPLIDDDRLYLRPRTDEEKKVVEVQSRDEAIDVLTPGIETASGALPGVDDGGEVRQFEAPGPVSIPSDGRAHSYQLFEFETEAVCDLVCLPEINASVVERSRQSNEGDNPLLAGPVRLVRNGGFAGRSQVPFVAAGERFALGWGSRDEIHVVRRTREHTEEVGLSRRNRSRLRAELYLSNTSREPVALALTERIPVSEVEEVRVAICDETSGGYRKDENGHLVWQVELGPRATREIELVYEIDAHRKVVWR